MLTHARRLGSNKDSSDSQDEKPRKKLHDIPRLRYTRKKSMKNTTRGSSSDSETNSDKYSYELSAFTQMKKRPYAKKREMVETCFDSAGNRKRATSAPGMILSSGSNDDGSDSLTISLTSTNSKSWYSRIMGSLVDSISGFGKFIRYCTREEIKNINVFLCIPHQVLPLSEKTEVEKTGCDTDYDRDFEGTVDEMTKVCVRKCMFELWCCDFEYFLHVSMCVCVYMCVCVCVCVCIVWVIYVIHIQFPYINSCICKHGIPQANFTTRTHSCTKQEHITYEVAFMTSTIDFLHSK